MENTQLNNVATSTLLQFQAASQKITNREEKIELLRKKMADTQQAANEYSEAKKEIKELQDLNQHDREFVKQAIDFYEDITGEAVGVGSLFNQEETEQQS